MSLEPPLENPGQRWFLNLYNFITDNRRQVLTVSGSVKENKESLEINGTTIAATIAETKNHSGLFVAKSLSIGIHTVTLTAGTWDGTNTVATFNAVGDFLAVYFDSNGDGSIINNNGVVLS